MVGLVILRFVAQFLRRRSFSVAFGLSCTEGGAYCSLLEWIRLKERCCVSGLGSDENES